MCTCSARGVQCVCAPVPVAGEPLRPTHQQTLVVLQLFSEETRDDELRAEQEPNLLLHTPSTKHPSPHPAVGKVHLGGGGGGGGGEVNIKTLCTKD